MLRNREKQIEEILMCSFELHILTNLISFLDEDIVIAQYDFQPASDSDLQFKKGDKLKIIKEWVNNPGAFLLI